MNTIKINDVTITSAQGGSISVSNGRVVINGQDVTPDAKRISIELQGNVDRLEVDAGLNADAAEKSPFELPSDGSGFDLVPAPAGRGRTALIPHDLIARAQAGDPEAITAMFEASKDNTAPCGYEPIAGVEMVPNAKGDMTVIRLVRAGVPPDAA